MKYYEEHEIAYQRLVRNGFVGWDRQKSVEDLISFSFKSELEKALTVLDKSRARILDIGCGTGTVAISLAMNGYEVTGIDISRTAIGKANEIARQLGIGADFVCGDFLSSDVLPGPYSMLVDSSFLHCLVFDEDRAKALRRIAHLVEEGGLFIVHTMVADRAFDFGDDFMWDPDGILWYLSKDHRVNESVAHPRGWATPQRRILPSFHVIEQINRSGFSLISTKLLCPASEKSPLVLFGIFRKPKGRTAIDVQGIKAKQGV
jgi:SAM-dependent methyltransferase